VLLLLLLLPAPPTPRYVCLKERNMLLTQISWEQTNERQLQQRSNMVGIYAFRIKQVGGFVVCVFWGGSEGLVFWTRVVVVGVGGRKGVGAC
jgi:hypothetical protein